MMEFSIQLSEHFWQTTVLVWLAALAIGGLVFMVRKYADGIPASTNVVQVFTPISFFATLLCAAIEIAKSMG